MHIFHTLNFESEYVRRLWGLSFLCLFLWSSTGFRNHKKTSKKLYSIETVEAIYFQRNMTNIGTRDKKPNQMQLFIANSTKAVTSDVWSFFSINQIQKCY